jgi:hypothetical protein
MPNQPGWYDDPNDSNAQRYWDGQSWTPHRQRKSTLPPARPSATPPPEQQPPPPPQQPPPPNLPPPPPQQPPFAGSPTPGDQFRSLVDKAGPHLEGGRRFWSGLSPRRQIILAIAALLVVVAAVAVTIGLFSHSFASATPGSPEDLCNTLRKNDTQSAAGEWVVHRLSQGDSKEKIFGVSAEAREKTCPDLVKNAKDDTNN